MSDNKIQVLAEMIEAKKPDAEIRAEAIRLGVASADASELIAGLRHDIALHGGPVLRMIANVEIKK
jgi:hypothetical protein